MTAAPLDVRDLVDDGVRAAADLGLNLTRAAVRRIVLAYLTAGNDPTRVRTYLLAYADPTGDRATRRADR